MYRVDERDRIVELLDVPQSSVGAPCPVVLAGEHAVSVAYYLQDTPGLTSNDGNVAEIADPKSSAI